MDVEFLKELYFKELERREQLDEVPTRLITGLTLVAALYTFYLRNFEPDSTWLTWLLALSVLATAVLFVLSLVWIARASVGYGYAFLAYPAEFEAFSARLRQYYASTRAAEGATEESVAKEISNSFRERLIEATTCNSKNNNKRSELFYNAKRFLVGIAASTLVSAIPVLSQLWSNG